MKPAREEMRDLHDVREKSGMGSGSRCEARRAAGLQGMCAARAVGCVRRTGRTGGLAPDGAATRSHLKDLSCNSEGAQKPWEGQIFTGFTGPFFLLLDSLITSIYQVFHKT